MQAMEAVEWDSPLMSVETLEAVQSMCERAALVLHEATLHAQRLLAYATHAAYSTATSQWLSVRGGWGLGGGVVLGMVDAVLRS